MANQIVLTAWDGAFLTALQADPSLPQMMASLKEKGVSVVAFTWRDRAELEPIRAQLNWIDPFITESGSGIFSSAAYNPFNPALGEQEGDYYVQELGCPYVQARAGLRVLANLLGHPLKGFGDFTVPKLQQFLEISEDAAHRAKAREFSELFMTPKAVEPTALMKAAEEMGFGIILRSDEESRFSELIGAKAGLAAAVEQVVAAYQRQLAAGETLRVLRMGDRKDELTPLAEALPPLRS
ncbi:MAG: haloacid dehalogenase, partial [Phormidesmis sp.]